MTVQELKAAGFIPADRTWTRGYISRKSDPNKAKVFIAKGSREGQFYALLPSWTSTRYCYRQYFVKEPVYILDKYADDYDTFYNDFWGDTDPDYIAECEAHGIPEHEITALWCEWCIQEPFWSWVDEHFCKL